MCRNIAIPLLEINIKELKICLYKDLYMNVQSTIINNIPVPKNPNVYQPVNK